MIFKRPQVWNKRNPNTPKDAIYVGRPTKFGNPFRLDSESQRKKIVAKFLEWLKTQPKLIKDIKRELKGKDLVCWCSPKPCHADVLLQIANETDSDILRPSS